MSLSLAINNAMTGLNTNQAALSLLSQNVSNANTEGYSRQVVEQSAVYNSGIGAGVKIEALARKVDAFMIQAGQTQTSITAKDGVIDDYMQRMQLLFGQPGQGNDLSAFVDNLFKAAQNLSDNPDRASMRESFVGSANILADQISAMANGLQTLRFEADRDIAKGIKLMNVEIQSLNKINTALNLAYSTQQPTAGLLDQRDISLRKIAAIVNIKTTESETGAVYVYTARGISLLDTTTNELSYSAASSVNSFINGDTAQPIQVTALTSSGDRVGQSIELVGESEEGSINSNITGGKLLGLLQLRDIEIPKIINELDQFAASLRDEINAIHNDGAGFPPISTMIGTTASLATDERDWTGSVRIAALKDNGTPPDNAYPSENGGVKPLTLDLGNLDIGNGTGRWTTQDIADEINAHFGTPQKKIHLNGLNNIKLVSMTENNPAGSAFSFDFDLENITAYDVQLDVTAITFSSGALTSALPSAYNIVAGADSRTGTTFSFDANLTGLTTIDIDIQVTNSYDGSIETATIQFTVDPADIDVKNDRYIGSVTAGTATEESPIPSNPLVSASIIDAIGNIATSGEDGYLKITTSSSDLVLAIDQMDSSDAGLLSNDPLIIGSEKGFSHYFGLNNFFVDTNETEGSAISMAVREDILQNPNFISTGELILSNQPAASGQALYTYELSAGNNAAISTISTLGTRQIHFEEAGALPSTDETLSSYASTILGSTTAKGTEYEQIYEHSKMLLDGYDARAKATSGVNLDEELAHTVIYQNAYAASAKVIITANQMMESLLAIFN